MRMERYQYKVKTVYQHLFTKQYDTISVNAQSEGQAETILSSMLSARDSHYTKDSCYLTYEYELVNLFE